MHKSVFDFFSGEDLYGDLDADGAVSRLSEAVRCRTVNAGEKRDNDSEFEKLRTVIKKGFPNVMRAGEMELIGRSILITIPGSDSSLHPCLYMSHQDVVPVVEGTEGDWTHDPFSGDVAEGAVWGRGTLDIKNMVFGILEAAEYLLKKGANFRRTAFLAFGDDEETINTGARDIAETLKAKGIRPEFVLDEGGGMIPDGAVFGAPGTAVLCVDVMEKGYADLEIQVKSEGGHSSRPFGGSSLERISRAIVAICDSRLPVFLPDPIKSLLAKMQPYVTEEPLCSLLSDIEHNSADIASLLLKNSDTSHYVTTTVAPTMIQGGSDACNVLPQNMSAVINFRINQGLTAEDIMDMCREAVSGQDVELRFIQANDPSEIARTDGFGYRTLTDTASRFFKDVIVVPCLSTGATDAHRYEIVCDTCLRFSPFIVSPDEEEKEVHGTDEHISIRSYLQGIRFLIKMMESSNL